MSKKNRETKVKLSLCSVCLSQMEEAGLQNQDSFICPICLDLLKDPVAITCGHSYCLGCIKDCWDQDDQKGVYSCPQCRHTFTTRPVLYKNTMLAELAEGLSKMRKLQAASFAESPSNDSRFADSPVVESPSADSPAVYSSSADSPAADSPATNFPAVDSPSADSPAVESPSADSPAADSPATDFSAANSPVESPSADSPAADSPATNFPAVDSPSADSPAVESPAADSPAADSPATDFSAANSPVESPSADSSAVYSSSANSPAADSPVDESPSSDSPAVYSSSADSHATDFPAADSPAVESPSADSPAADSPAADFPSADSPAVESSTAESPAGSGGVECDICTGTKQTAVQSCLVCLASFCKAHIQPHYEIPAYKKHRLVEASMNLQEKICSLHDKLLEFFCRTDQQVICYLCVMDKHSGHRTVSAAAERAEKQKQLMVTWRNSQQRIQQTQKEQQELRQAMETLRRSTQTAVEDSEQLFSELIQSVERRSTEVKKLITAQEKAELSLGEDLLKKLEKEDADLRSRDIEMEKLLRTEDHVHFLQSFPSLSARPQSADLRRIPISSQFSMEKLNEAVTEMKERVGLEVVSGALNDLMPKTREDFLKYSCQLTLDPNTAHTHIALSERNTRATVMRQNQPYPSHPERFDKVQQVLCRESLSGRCYWEAEFNVSNLKIVVAYKNIKRKGKNNESRFGPNAHSWSLFCCGSRFSFRHKYTETQLPVFSCPSRIGVYVDQSAGILSFYSIYSDEMILLHRVHTTFTQPLYPGFGVYNKDTVLQICDLN